MFRKISIAISLGLLAISCARFDSEGSYLGLTLLGGSSSGGPAGGGSAVFHSFSFLAADNPSLSGDVTGTISGTTITLTAPLTVDLSGLVATFSAANSSTISVDGGEQTSGTSALDFTSAKTYTLRGTDGVDVTYTVTVSLDATDGLVLYMPFSGDAQDSVGTNHGTVTGPTLTADRQGNANSAYLYGTGGEIILTSGPAVAATGSWTWALWVRPDAFGADTANSGPGDGDFILDRTPGTNPLVNFKISHSQKYVGQVRNDAGGGLTQMVGTAATSGAWAHLAIVRESGVDFRFYIDGTQAANIGGDTLGSLTPNTPILGNHVNFANQFLTGVIDEFRVYDRLLSDQEIANLANVVD